VGWSAPPARGQLAAEPHPLRRQSHGSHTEVSAGWVLALLHNVYDQPEAASVHAQLSRVPHALADKLPQGAAHLDATRTDILAFTRFPKAIWRQIWSATRKNG
jgi:transposase-like protein